jgi:cytochrome b561
MLMFFGVTIYEEFFGLGYFLGLNSKMRFKNVMKRGCSKTNFIFLSLFGLSILRGFYFFYSNDSFSLLKFRWLLFFAVIILLICLEIDSDKPKPRDKAFSLKVIFLSTGLYILVNFLSILKFGSSEKAQYAENSTSSLGIFANTAYVTSSLIAMAFCLNSIFPKNATRESRSYFVLGYFFLFVSATVTLSRSAFFALFVLFLVNSGFYRVRIVVLNCLLVGISSLGFWLGGSTPLNELRLVGLQPDRVNQYSSTFEGFKDLSLLEKFVGSGWRTSGIVLGDMEIGQAHISMAPAILIETGIIGTAVFFWFVIRSFREVLFNRTHDGFVILFITKLLVLSSFIIVNEQDSILFYFFVWRGHLMLNRRNP